MEKDRMRGKTKMDKWKKMLLLVMAAFMGILALCFVFYQKQVRHLEETILQVKEEVEVSSNKENSAGEVSASKPFHDEIFEEEIKALGVNLKAELPYQIKLNRLENCVTVYGMDQEGSYSIPVKAMICSTGKATPVGSFSISERYEWKKLNGNVWGQYATRIKGHILFHSVPFQQKEKDSLIADYYNKLGEKASAGCIRLTTADAKWIYDNCPEKTNVVIYEEEGIPGPLGKPDAMKVPDDCVWDPTDPDPKNPYNQNPIEIKARDRIELERGEEFLPGSFVQAADNLGNDLTDRITMKEPFDSTKTGSYEISCEVMDFRGNKQEFQVMAEVLDTKKPEFRGINTPVLIAPGEKLTKQLLLEGVSLWDLEEELPKENISFEAKENVEGKVRVIYRGMDVSGNEEVREREVLTDRTAPLIVRKKEALERIPLNQFVDEDYAKSRVEISDDLGEAELVDVQISPIDWGYEINYAAADSVGNIGKFKEQLFYTEYHIAATDSVDEKDPLKGLLITDDYGQVIETDGEGLSIQTDITKGFTKNGKKYDYITYTVTYQCPLGKKTVSCIGKVSPYQRSRQE